MSSVANRIEAIAAANDVVLADRGNDTNDIIMMAEALELETVSYAGSDDNFLDLIEAELTALSEGE